MLPGWHVRSCQKFRQLHRELWPAFHGKARPTSCQYFERVTRFQIITTSIHLIYFELPINQSKYVTDETTDNVNFHRLTNRKQELLPWTTSLISWVLDRLYYLNNDTSIPDVPSSNGPLSAMSVTQSWQHGSELWSDRTTNCYDSGTR